MSKKKKPIDKEALAQRFENYHQEKKKDSNPPPLPLDYEEITGVLDLALGTFEEAGENVARKAEEAVTKLDSISPQALETIDPLEKIDTTPNKRLNREGLP